MIKVFAAISRSLSARLLVPLLLTVVTVLTLYAVVSFRSTRSRLTTLVGDGAERCSSLILGATHDNMLLNRKDQLQSTIERLAGGPGVRAIRVYDTRGWVALSAASPEVGERVTVLSEPCRSCHGRAGRLPVKTIARTASRGGAARPALRHLAIIPNEAACAASGCHAGPEKQPVLGILEVEMSLGPLEEAVASGGRQMAWAGLSLMLLTGAVTGLVVNRLVHRPVSLLRSGTERIAHGGLDTRIEVPGHHELAGLAEAFNRMTADLKAARLESSTWSERLEAKVVEKTEELQRAQRQVLHMEKMSSLGKLAATVAHELNNPLSGILTYARLVERELGRGELGEAEREELGEYLRLMEVECGRCGDIVKNLLLFARRPGGAERAPVDVNEVVDRSLKLVRHHLEISNVRLRKGTLAGDPVIHADVGELEQALVALFVNAVEAMGGPGCEEGELVVSLAGDEREVCIDVADTGVGIHPDVLPHIFEPFFSTKHKESGVGLGLAVVYGIVERHGGTIAVESEPGRGTIFHLTLPRHAAPAPPDARSAGGSER